MTTTAPDDWHELFSAALDGRLDDAGRTRLTTLLADDAEARRLWFLYADNEVGLAELRPIVMPSRPVAPRGSWVRRRPWLTAAACFLGGLCCASVGFAYLGPSAGKVTTLVDESFETSTAPGVSGMPAAAGVWSGDITELAAAQQGASPADGARMLRFLRGDTVGRPIPGSFSSDVFRLIDVRPLRKELQDGEAVVQLTALFNAAAADVDHPTHCALTIFALDAASAEDPELVLSRDALAYSHSSRVGLDADAATWQAVTNELRVPVDADFLMIRVGVSYDPRRPGPRPDDFPGHFVDDVQLVLARRPIITAP